MYLGRPEFELSNITEALNSLESAEGVFRDAGVVAEVHAGADGGEDERVAVAAARHPDGVGRVQHDVVLVPPDLETER